MLNQLRADIKNSADPKKAEILQRFFKTGKGQYGEGDIFLGLMVPQQRLLVKKYAADLSLVDLDKLIKSKIHEERLIALLILVRQFQEADRNPAAQKTIYNFYLSHTARINNWDLVDLSAPKIVGAYLRNKGKSILYKLAKSKNLWERRIAVLATFDSIYLGHPDEALNICHALLNDEHDLINKATGWMLREVGKRCGEKYLLDFLDKHAARMPRTMLRYAIERLPEKKHLYYLNTKNN